VSNLLREHDPPSIHLEFVWDEKHLELRRTNSGVIKFSRMGDIASAPLHSTSLLILTIAFFITSALTVFDRRLTQAIKRGDVSPDEPSPPFWLGFVYYVHWGIGIALLVINWKYALLVFVVKLILAFLPVLEITGNVMMAPFKPRR